MNDNQIEMEHKVLDTAVNKQRIYLKKLTQVLDPSMPEEHKKLITDYLWCAFLDGMDAEALMSAHNKVTK